ncbi:ABC transporter permease [Salmonirosea aquatica]|uniref:FtsX-like permease family protein n=1 Tax=Salmonirosea aquatica TaxID=2654236 RepID=A0A7C9BD40_9BACT|nr:FtsX-like permease family protein [Cytophagaceae bacterium SJW1-29]
MPLGNALRTQFGSSFKYVVMSSATIPTILSVGNDKFTKGGRYIESNAPDMLSLHMIHGVRTGLKDPNSILLSRSVAQVFFGNQDPIGKAVKINNGIDVKVAGVYEDFPENSTFNDVLFLAPWDIIARDTKNKEDWDANQFMTYVQLADKADVDQVSARIKDIKMKQVPQESKSYKPEMFLFPMANWHLYSDFENGVSVGGRIQYVWLFGIIGAFVLLLACINFMNLSTARSEKRAKEVGLRKAVGSLRTQLVIQFFSESLLVVGVAFVLTIGLTVLLLPQFNVLSGKQLSLIWENPYFWLGSVGFILLTGLLAGSYPALYLSSFQPVKVLKGAFRVGRFAAIPRKVLVVVQFTVSVTLIIGTLIVYRQIQFAQSRPIGYDRNGLIIFQTPTPTVHTHFDAIRDELKQAGAIAEMTESHSPMTDLFLALADFDWPGKDPNLQASIGVIQVSHSYGKTVDWQIQQGRDFSRALASDSSGIILNESAVKLMGLQQPVGNIIKLRNLSFRVIGVIKDMVMESPYEPVRQSVYLINDRKGNFAILKLAPQTSSHEALAKIEATLKKYDPESPFDFKFVDQEYARKFDDEVHIGTLALVFTILAIFISCLGLFGLASFVAEQRTKEIGVRKVLGATVFNLWQLLSKDFVVLVLIALGIATPIAWYFLSDWLAKYEYRTDISWWIFAVSGAGAVVLTLLTVSYQSIKAALMNPVKSLRSE